MSTKNLYQQLSILPDAPKEDIAHAVRHAKKMNSVDIKILNAAEEHLLDDEKRIVYDGYLVKSSQTKRSFEPPVYAYSNQTDLTDSNLKNNVMMDDKAEKKPEKAANISAITTEKTTNLQNQEVKPLDFPVNKNHTFAQNQETIKREPIEFTLSQEQKLSDSIDTITHQKRLCHGCSRLLRARSLFCDQCGTRANGQSKIQTSRVLEQRNAALLAIFLGGIGAHKFYLGQIKAGILSVIFIWTLIPVLLGIYEGVKLLQISQTSFFKRYGQER